MPTVALDTSALMTPVEVGVRVFDELSRLLGDAEFVVPRVVLDELSGLAGGASTEATAASVGLDLAGRCRVVDVDGIGFETADDALVELARRGAVDYVVTNDADLGDRLLVAGVPVVGVRGENTLAITEP